MTKRKQCLEAKTKKRRKTVAAERQQKHRQSQPDDVTPAAARRPMRSAVAGAEGDQEHEDFVEDRSREWTCDQHAADSLETER